MARSITLGVVGDSAAGKTTLTRGLVRVLGEENVTHVCVDDYHRYDRRQRAQRNITPLHPDCNYMDMMAQHLGHLRAGEPFLKPVYRHEDGTFGPLVRVDPKQFAVVDGLLGFYTEELRKLYDVRLFLAPPEELRRLWKVRRDCSRRGYTTDQVLAELDRREPCLRVARPARGTAQTPDGGDRPRRAEDAAECEGAKPRPSALPVHESIVGGHDRKVVPAWPAKPEQAKDAGRPRTRR